MAQRLCRTAVLIPTRSVMTLQSRCQHRQQLHNDAVSIGGRALLSTSSNNKPGKDQAPPRREIKRWRIMSKLEAERGMLYEQIEVNKTHGKLFKAATALVPADKAVPFPDFDADTLSGRKKVSVALDLRGQVAVVGVSFKHFGYAMLPAWLGALKRQHPQAVTANLNLAEGLVISFLRPLLVMDMKRNVAPEQHSSTYVLFGDAEDIRTDLDIMNRLTGHIFLLDKEGKIRWRGCGIATPEELDSMLACYEQLVEPPGNKRLPHGAA